MYAQSACIVDCTALTHSPCRPSPTISQFVWRLASTPISHTAFAAPPMLHSASGQRDPACAIAHAHSSAPITPPRLYAVSPAPATDTLSPLAASIVGSQLSAA